MFRKNKVTKLEVFDLNNKSILVTEKKFTIPKQYGGRTPENKVIIKGDNLPELSAGCCVYLVVYTKAGERKRYSGNIAVSTQYQLNVDILPSKSENLPERRRYFKIKTVVDGNALFVTRDDKIMKFDDPIPLKIHDINVGGVFIVAGYVFSKGDIIMINLTLYNKTIEIAVEILRVKVEDDGNIGGYGCRFVNLSRCQEEVITRYIYSEELKQRKKAEGGE